MLIQCIKKMNSDEIYSKCFLCYWIGAITNTSLKRIMGGGFYSSLVSILICFFLFFVFVLRSIYLLGIQKKIYKFLVPFIILLLIYLFSFVMGTPFKPMLNLIMWGALGMLVGTIIVSISDYKVLYNELKRAMPIILLLSLLVVVANNVAKEYMMHYSFLLVLPVCFCFYVVFKEKKFIYLIPLSIFLLLILLYGSRGPLVCILAFILMFMLFKSGKRYTWIIMIIFGVALFLFYKFGLNYIDSILHSQGIYSRTIELLNNNPTYDSGRSILHEQAKAMIDKKPILGWGVAGERQYMDIYPHNIVLEFFLDYGVPLGVVLLIICTALLVIGFINSKNYFLFFFMVFLSISISLLWSGSYLSSISFWITIYLSVKTIKTKRVVTNNT